MPKILNRIIVYLAILPLVIILFFALSFMFTALGAYRLHAISFAALFGPMIAWLIYPMIYWRPMSRQKVLLFVGILLVSYACIFLLAILEIGLPDQLKGPYGLYNMLVYALIPAVFFELHRHFSRKEQ